MKYVRNGFAALRSKVTVSINDLETQHKGKFKNYILRCTLFHNKNEYNIIKIEDSHMFGITI
jgi:hypothetical protein